MITERAIVTPPPSTLIVAATSIGPCRRNTNQATTAICPTNIAAKTNRPHSAVPQNFQIRGLGSAGISGAAAMGSAGVSGRSINGLSTAGSASAITAAPAATGH
jgi:hypothetical protein